MSTWLVYADGVREQIEHAIARQASQPTAAKRSRSAVSQTSLRTDLELARAQIRQLRAERDQLRGQLRNQLGDELEQLGSKTLTSRIDELTRHGQALADQHQQTATENQLLRQRVTELEDELAAARTSLRQMIRETSKA